MDSSKYLQSFGWQPGTALQKGGLKKPILVAHKFDLKGVGETKRDTVCWWEKVFDSRLKDMKNVKQKSEVEITKDLIREEKKSLLYSMFIKGETLIGTKTTKIGRDNQSKNDEEDSHENEQLLMFFSDSENEEKDKKKKNKKAKKSKKEKKEKKQKKKEKKEKKENKEKKESLKKAKKLKATKKAKKAAKKGTDTQKIK